MKPGVSVDLYVIFVLSSSNVRASSFCSGCIFWRRLLVTLSSAEPSRECITFCRSLMKPCREDWLRRIFYGGLQDSYSTMEPDLVGDNFLVIEGSSASSFTSDFMCLIRLCYFFASRSFIKPSSFISQVLMSSNEWCSLRYLFSFEDSF